MQAITLIAANILLLLILAAGVYIERRVTRLELDRTKDAAQARELLREAGEGESGMTDIETRRAKDAERRFTEGVASILSYELGAGKEAERGENTGA